MTIHAAETLPITITGYRITATCLDRFRGMVDCTNDASMGPNRWKLYATHAAAKAGAAEMQGAVAGSGLAPSTVYTVETCGYIVREALPPHTPADCPDCLRAATERGVEAA